MDELQGLQVLVTRPNPAGNQLCALIEQHGGRAIACPTIAFESIAAHDVLAILPPPDWLIFSSPQAVREGIPTIQQAGLDCSRASFAAVGQGTAEAIAAALPVQPIYPDTSWDSEGLLALSAFQTVQGKHIVIVKGEGGRGVLETVLASRGASVSSVIVYRRIMPQVDVRPIVPLFKARAIQAVVVTSGEGMRHFKQLFEIAAWHEVCDTPLIVVNDRGKKLAQYLGFRRIWIAGKASSTAILSYLIQKKDVLCPTKPSK